MSPAGSPTRRAVRWGLADVIWVWFVGLVAGAIALTICASLRGRTNVSETDGIDLAVGLIAQNGAILGALVVLGRLKGRGTLRADFGLTVRPGDWPWLAGGVILQVVSLLLVELLELVGDTIEPQQAVETLERTQGPELVAIVLGVTLLAPLVEELLYRGLLLRALLRRTTPVPAVLISSLVFAGVHLLDPSTLPLMTPLLLLAVISGIRAVRTGDLSQSILLHVGFNLLSAVVLVAS